MVSHPVEQGFDFGFSLLAHGAPAGLTIATNGGVASGRSELGVSPDMVEDLGLSVDLSWGLADCSLSRSTSNARNAAV